MQSKVRWRAVWIAVAAFVLIWARTLVWHAISQLFLGLLVALLALPLMKRLEKHVRPVWAASLSMTSLSVALIAAFVLLLPPLVNQFKHLAALLPGMYGAAENLVKQGEAWLLKTA